jgi:hypothetical protein
MPGANNYEIPFGLNASQFFDGLTEIDKGVDKTAANVEEAGKQMQKSFNDAATAGDKLADQMAVDAEQAAKLRDQAKTLGKELGDALSGKGVSGDFEKKLNTFNDLLGKFSNNANKGIKFNIDTAKLEQFEKLLADGANELEVLNAVIAVTKEQLATMDPNGQEWQDLNAQLQIAEGFLEGLGQATEGVTQKNLSLKGELRQIKSAMSEMELAGKGDTKEFIDMAIRAGELEDQIGDVSARVRVLASDTKYLDAGTQAFQGLIGAATAGAGAFALFGGESEEANKIIQKVTGAMAVLQGIQAAATALNKDSALSVLLFSNAQRGAVVSTTALAAAEGVETGVTVAATAATESFTAALLSNPITAILVGIAALIAALIAFSSGSSEAEKATKSLNDELERQDAILSLDEASLKRRTDLLVAQAKAQGKAASDITTIEGKALQERLALRTEAYNEFLKQYNDFDKRAHLSADDNKKLEDELIKRQQQLADDQNAIQIKKLDRDKQVQDEAVKAAKDAETLSKKQIEDAKKAAEERKKVLEQQIKFTRELEASRVDAIKDQYEKERAQARANANAKIAELEAEKSLSVKAETQKQAVIKQIRASLGVQLQAIDDKQAADQAVLQLKASQLQAQYREEGIVKELETIRLGYEEKKKEIETQFKDEGELRQQLLDQLNEAQIREQKKAQAEFNNKQIKNQEEQAVLEVETATKFLPDLPGIEEKKQVAILQVKVKFAQQALDALIEQGNAENSVVVLQAKKQVQELQKALGVAVKEAAKQSQGVDWFDMLGLGELSEDDRKAVVDAAQKALGAIQEITGFIVEQYQQQIDKKQEVIDQIDGEIEDLEDQLDKEKDLREQGFANNVEVIEAELAEKQRQKDEEIKQQEEMQKKQQQVKKAQLILDTAVQASNLITASTEIFAALAGIPFVGIPLAIATIALMTGAFVTAKVKAFQLVNDQKQSFGEGGTIDGKPHTQGGQKYVSIDGSGGVVELEGGEHVTRKRQAMKYATLLDAINNDDLAGMNDEALRAMLAGMGIRLNSDKPAEVLKAARERDDYKQQVMLVEAGAPDISGDVKMINENVGFLAAKERDRVERWTDGEWNYEKRGQRTTRIKIKTK